MGPIFMMLPAQFFISTQSDGIVSFISQDAAPEAFRSPDARAQGFELNDLAVVYEEIHLRAVVLDVPLEDLRVGGLEHDLLQAERVDDLSYRVGAPSLDVLGDSFRFDHQHVGPGLQKTLCLPDGPFHVARPFGLQFGYGGRPAGAELDADFRLGFEPGLLRLFNQPQEVFHRRRDEAAEAFDDVEAQLPPPPDVALAVLRAVRQDALDEASGRAHHLVSVTEVYQLFDRPARHEREGASGEFEAVHIIPHRLQHVLQIALAHRRVIRPAYLGHAALSRLGLALVEL